MANYNVDIALKIGGTAALKQLNDKLKETERIQKNIEELSVGSSSANYLRNKLTAEKQFADFKQKTLAAEQKLFEVEQQRARAEQTFGQEANRIARQKSAEFIRQKRLLLELEKMQRGDPLQYLNPIGPNASGFQEYQKQKRLLEIANRLKAVEDSKAKRLANESSITQGLLRLKKSILEAARSEAQTRGEILDTQRKQQQSQEKYNKLVDDYLAKLQRIANLENQYSRPIGPIRGNANQYPGPIGPGPVSNAPQGPSSRLIDRPKGRAGARRSDLSQSLGLSLGFPLLFGGGPGSILGGLGGALIGKGAFGSQILGSGLGAAFDQAIVKATEFAQGISNVGTALDTAINANLISSKELETNLQDLANAGFKVAAGIQAQQEYADSISQIDFERAQEAAKSIDRLTRLWAQFTNGVQTDLLILIKTVADTVSNQIDIGQLLDRAQRTINAAASKNLGTRDQRFDLARQSLEFNFVPSAENKQNLIDAIKKLEDEFPELKVKAKLTIEQSQKQAFQKELETVVGAQGLLQTIQSVQSIVGRYNEQSNQANDLREKATKAVESAERRIADLRLSLERKAEDMRLSAIAKANEIEDIKAKQRIKELAAGYDLASAKFAASFKENDPTKDIAVAYQSIASDLNLELAKGQEDRAALERNFALEQKKFELDATRTRLNAEKTVARARQNLEQNLATTRKEILRIESNLNRDKFDLQKDLDKLALQRLKIETQLLQLTLKANDQLSETFKGYFTEIFNVIKKAEGLVEKAKPPTARDTSGASGAPSADIGGVSFAGIDAAADQLKRLKVEINEVLEGGTGPSSKEFAKRIVEANQAILGSLTPLEKQNEELKRLNKVRKLVGEGYSESDAAAIVRGNEELQNLIVNIGNAIKNSRELRPEFVAAFGEGSDAVRAIDGSIAELQKRLGLVTGEVGKLEEAFEKINDVEKLGLDVAGIALNGIVDTLMVGITEADKFNESLQEMTKSILVAISKALILFSIQQALNALGGGADNPQGVFSFLSRALSGKALGGPVSGNQPYLVGERGPELFVPGAQGNIVPNSAMGSANVTVNVDASGSSVEGDSAQAGQLGKMLGAAVQAELIKQKRPGGLLA